jgi:hypothetical protein
MRDPNGKWIHSANAEIDISFNMNDVGMFPDMMRTNTDSMRRYTIGPGFSIGGHVKDGLKHSKLPNT